MVNMKGGFSGAIMFSGIFIVIAIIGVVVYINNSELKECKRSTDVLSDECECNGP